MAQKEKPLSKRNSIPGKKLVLFLFSLSLSFLHVTHGHSPDPTTIQELRIRNGLPNFFRKLASKKEVKVAYLGGSITKANGWRTKSFEWLEKQYPQVTFKQINAAIGGTNSDFGACRLDEYVLQYQPDLLFVEYRVNSGGNKPERAIEGIVRRTKAANPETDICFVYTLGEWMIETLAQGKQTWYGTKMERIANHYGIPSIDYAPEVIGQLEKG
ncbi:MAG: SGNH/GDSL hydrolase family protein, partial [Bacteroidota bacterium]